MKKFLDKVKQKRMVIDIICILIVVIFLSIPMMRKNTDIYLDDGSQHLMRAYGTYQSMKQNGTGMIISDFAVPAWTWYAAIHRDTHTPVKDLRLFL